MKTMDLFIIGSPAEVLRETPKEMIFPSLPQQGFTLGTMQDGSGSSQ